MNKLFGSLGLVLSLFFAPTLKAEILCVDTVDKEHEISFREISDAPWANDVKGSVKTQSGFIKGQSRPGIKVPHEMYYRVDEPAQLKSKEWKILIHGLGDHSGHMNALTEKYLKDGYRVGRFDLYGHGRTFFRSIKKYKADVDKTVDIRSNALSILEAFEQLGIDRVDIIGHSYGGAVAALIGAYGKNILNKKLEVKISGIRLIAFYAQDLGEWIASQAVLGTTASESVAKGVQFFVPKVVSENLNNHIDQNSFYLNQLFSTADALIRYLGFGNLKNSLTDPNLNKILYNNFEPYFIELAKANGHDINDPKFKEEIDLQIRSAISVTRGARKFNLFHPRQELPRTEIPIQIIAAENDELVPLSMMKQARLVLKDIGFKIGDVVEIKNAGHLLTRTHSDEVYKALKKKL